MTWADERWLYGWGIVMVLAWSARFVLFWTPSNSLPKGVYMRAVLGRDIRVGDLVWVETPPALKGLLPVGYQHAGLLKQVAALGGMEVCWRADAMTVHDGARWVTYLKHPAITRRDMPEGCEVLTAAYMVIVGQHGRSYDSRYFGPVLRAYGQFRVWPLWTWSGD